MSARVIAGAVVLEGFKGGDDPFQVGLDAAQARYRPLFNNTKRLRELISELETLSARAVEQAEGWATP